MSSVYRHIPRSTAVVESGVTSFNGRVGAVMSQMGDYTAVQISYNNSGTLIIAVNVQDAITELDDRVANLNLENIPGNIDPERISSPFYEYRERTAYTSDDTLTEIYNEEFEEDLVATYTVFVTAIQYAGTSGAYGNTGSFKRTLVVKNLAGIATTRVLQWDYQSLEDPSWGIFFETLGNELSIDVKGNNDMNIKWVCQLEKVITTVM